MDIITTMTSSASLRAAREACGTGFTFDLSGYPSAWATPTLSAPASSPHRS